jgi:2-hydroxychromene-2-carboxylate isomerase
VPKPEIDYFFTPQSPWAYLGHARFMAIARRHAASVRIKPVNFGPVFAASGGLPLGQRAPQRQAYRLAELDRFRRFLNVPLNLHPRHFPVASDLAACLLIAIVEKHDDDTAMQVQTSIGAAVWSEEKDIADGKTLAEIARQHGLDGEALVHAAQEPGALTRYEALTAEAIARGVFGAPTYIFDDELFWGQDRLDMLDLALAEKLKAT